MRKKILSVALALSVITTLIPANASNAAKPKKPVLSQSGISMTIGTKKTIKLKKAPALTKKKLKLVKWSSSNKKVATVAVKGRKKTKAVIKAVASGKAIIKVKYGGKSYKCTVVVQEAIQDSTVSVPTTEKNTEKVTTEKSTEQERTTEKSTEQDNTTEEPSTEHVHKYGEYKTLTKATCITPGVEVRTCSCGEIDSREIKALGHDWDNGVVTKKATCSTEGVRTFTCANCGGTKTESIAKLDHTWNDPIVLEQSTCAKEGTKSYTCSVCGETKLETIPVTDKHTWGNYVVTKQPTCIAGEKTRTCSVCKAQEIEEIKPNENHSYNAGIVTVEPTCTAKGVKTYTCSICGNKKTEAIDKTDTHTWDEYGVFREPTYSSGGIEYPQCSVCGQFQQIKDKAKYIPCLSIISRIVRKEQDTEYYSISGGTSPEYLLYESGTNPSSKYFKEKNTDQKCKIECQTSTSKYIPFDQVDTSDIDTFKFTITHSGTSTTKTYSYSELSSLFTPEKQLEVLIAIYGEKVGTSYNNKENDAMYNQGGYAGSINTALISIPRNYTYEYDDGEVRTITSCGKIYISGMALAMICYDMGYVCNGAFSSNVYYFVY